MIENYTRPGLGPIQERLRVDFDALHGSPEWEGLSAEEQTVRQKEHLKDAEDRAIRLSHDKVGLTGVGVVDIALEAGEAVALSALKTAAVGTLKTTERVASWGVLPDPRRFRTAVNSFVDWTNPTITTDRTNGNGNGQKNGTHPQIS